MKASIVIRTRNETKNIRRCLDCLSQQNHLPSEIIIVDNRSEDETLHIVTSYKSSIPIHIINNPILGYASGLNIGAAAAQNKYVVFLSADCFPERHWLSSLINVAEEKKCSVVQGTELVPLNSDIHLALSNSSQIKPTAGAPIKIEFFSNTNTLYNKRDLENLLPFVEIYPRKGGEDTLMSLKYSESHLKAYRCPAAKVVHDKFPTTESFIKRCIDHGRVSRAFFSSFPLKPRLYLNFIYWSIQELRNYIRTRNKIFLKIAYFRFVYNIKGFFFT